jgi:hypothetical protein
VNSWKDEWNEILKTKDVYLAFDNDKAGKEAIRKIGRKISPLVSIMMPPEKDKDWNDYINEPDTVESAKNQSKILLSWFVDEYKNLPERLQIEKSKELYEWVQGETGTNKKYLLKQIKGLCGLSERDFEKFESPVKDIVEDTKQIRGIYYDESIGIISVQMWRKEKSNHIRDSFLITSNRRFLHWEDELIFQAGYWQKSRPIQDSEERWTFRDINKWIKGDKNVVATELIDIVTNKLVEYIEFRRPVEAIFIGLWIVGTYLFPLFSSYPYLYITGEKASGKSKLLDVISLLAWNPISTVDISSSALFRIIDSSACTLIIDEAEQLQTKDEKHAEILSILNAGYKRGSKVYRCQKDSFEV